MDEHNKKHRIESETGSTIFENEQLKSTLRKDFGATFNESNSIPPEIENQYLNNMIAFEKAMKDARRIVLYDFIGKPLFQKIEQIKEEEISAELRKIEDLLAQHCITLDCICKYSDATIYKFITEELFLAEIDDIALPGFWTHFIYEEFHPNHEYDIRRQCEEMVQILFSNDWRHINSGFRESIFLNGKLYHRNHLDNFYCWFLDQWNSATVVEIVVQELTFDEQQAGAVFQVAICNNVDNSVQQLRFDFKLTREFDWWMICFLDIEVLAE